MGLIEYWRQLGRDWRKGPHADVVWVVAVGVLSRLWVLVLAAWFNHRLSLGRTPQTLLCSWDCGLYMSIVTQGYEAQPGWGPDGDAASWAFFPLFPLLARLVSQLSTLGPIVSAVLVANLCFLAGLVVLHRVARKVADAATARFVVLAFAFSPLALYFSVPYTESLYFLLMVTAMYCASTGRWLAAGAAAAALSATRNLGVFVALSLAVLGLQQFGWRRLVRLAAGTERFYVALALAPLGLFAFMLFLYHRVGDALAFKNVQVAWGGTPGNPLNTLAQAWRWGGVYEYYCMACVALALLAGAYLVRRGYLAEALILLLGTLIPITVRMQSAPRYALTLYPFFLALGLVLRARRRLQAWLVVALLPPSAFMVASWVAEKAYTI